MTNTYPPNTSARENLPRGKFLKYLYIYMQGEERSALSTAPARHECRSWSFPGKVWRRHLNLGRAPWTVADRFALAWPGGQCTFFVQYLGRGIFLTEVRDGGSGWSARYLYLCIVSCHWTMIQLFNQIRFWIGVIDYRACRLYPFVTRLN